MNVREQVERAIRSYGDRPEGEATVGDDGLPVYGLAQALGWIVANQIVATRYHDTALDAIPVEHPEHGWDRFLLTRRVSCDLAAAEPADAFGLLLLTGTGAPRLASPDGTTRLALGDLLRADPERAIGRLLELLPAPGLLPGDHSRCRHARAPDYPRLYQAVAEIIAERPGVVAAREIYVDTEQIEGAFHPLYLHSAAQAAGLVYDWFAVQSRAYAAFFRIQGDYAVYETDTGGWSSVVRQLAGQDLETVKRRLLGWLRLEGGPDPAVD